MHEIFISYSSKHRELTRELVARIEAQYGAGSVWWDRELEARGPYHEQIRAALEAARCVVVIWTSGALVSEYVYAEAVSAHAAHKLVNLRPAETPFAQIPEPFNIHHIEEAAEAERLLSAIASVMAGRALPTRVPLHELYWRQHGQRIVDPKRSTLPARALDVSPSQLLQARYEQVDYVDATGLRADLLQWALNHPHRAAGRLLHGPGGIGKTRLLIEAAAALRCAHGWMAGFVERVPAQADDATRRQHAQALKHLIELGEEPGLLLVLDYAEGRQDELVQIAGWIESRPEAAQRPIRLVLLARSAGEWWERQRSEHEALERLFSSVGPAPAPPVVAFPALSGEDARLALFDASLRAYRPHLQALGLLRGKADPPEALRRRIAREDDHERPLAVQMAALVWLVGDGANSADLDIAALLDRMRGIERQYWQRALGPLGDDDTVALERGVAQATLVQGVPTDEGAQRLLGLDGYYAGRRTALADVAPTLRRLQRLYGQGEGGLAALEPDLLGEHWVACVGDPALLDACVAWLDAGAAGEGGAAGGDGRSRHALVTVLQRASQAQHGPAAVAGATRLIDRLLRCHVSTWAAPVLATAADTSGALAARLDHRLPHFDEATLTALEARLPHRSIALDRFGAAVAQRLLDELQARSASQHSASMSPEWPVIARLLINLGSRLSALGQRELACSAANEAVVISRRLAASHPDAFLPDLAISLNNLGNGLSALDRRKSALVATEEAVTILRRLAERRPDAFLPDLAMSLNNLGNRLSALGRREPALAAAEEAVTIRRQLAEHRPDAFLPALATSLNNLGKLLSDLGRREQALVATDEAMTIRRRLAERRPDAFLPDLAMSLNNLGNRLSALGRREPALATADEAVMIFRRLAESRPDAFLPDLAMSLCARSMVLAASDRLAEAAAAAAEGLKLLLPLLRRYPAALRPLALSLGHAHLEHAEAASQPPDAALLKEVRSLIGHEPPSNAT